MTREEAFVRWNTEIQDWLKYLNKREELIQIHEEKEKQIGNLAKIRRQKQALYNVRSGVFANPQLLLAFIHPESISQEHIRLNNFSSDKLNDSQKMAVNMALSGQCFTLIQGPPGTGKTSVITEICSQILLKESEARILVCSETHVAVNNIFHNLENKFLNFMGLRINDKEFDEEKTRERFQANKVLLDYRERLLHKEIPHGVADFLKK